MDNNAFFAGPYQAPGPYPSTEGLCQNRKYARILMDSYSGRQGEQTAIHQYIYHHILSDDNKKLADTMRGVAIVEMHHLDILGDCIRQLGLCPKFCSYAGGRTTYWNASYVAYGENARQRLEFDIQSEEAAIRGFRSAISRIDNCQIQQILERIIADEKVHIQLFRCLLKELDSCK